MEAPKPYKAFISYKHVSSTRFALALETALKRYAKPLLAEPLRIFRDENHLAPGVDLPGLIVRALEDSEYFILLASPEAARSPWVRDELDRWCQVFGRSQNLIVILVNGEIAVDEQTKAIDWSRTDALPPILAEHFQTIPLYVDMREIGAEENLTEANPDFKRAINGIIARFRNIDPNEMLGEEILQHRRNLRLRNIAAGLIVTFAIASLIAAYLARTERAQALFALAQARASELAARAQAARSTRPDLSLALALRSLEPLEPYGLSSREGEQALRGTLAATRGQRLFCAPGLKGSFSGTTSVDVSSDGTLVAVGTMSGVLCIYRDGVLTELLQSFGGAPISQLSFTRDARWLLTHTRDGYTRALDLSATGLDPSTEKFSRNNYAFNRIGDANLTSDFALDNKRSRMAFHNHASNAIEVWQLASFNPKGRQAWTIPVSDTVIAVALSPDGKRVGALTISESSTDIASKLEALTKNLPFRFQTWSLSAPLTAAIPEHRQPVLEQLEAYLDDGYGRGVPDGVLRLDDSGRWSAVGIALREAHSVQTQLAVEVLSHAGRTTKRVQRYGGAYKEQSDMWNPQWTRVADVGFSPDGRWLYVVRGYSIRLWRTDGSMNVLNPVATLSAPGSSIGASTSLGIIYTAAISPDSRWLMVTDSNGVLTSWNLDVVGHTLQSSPTFVVPASDPLTGNGSTLRFNTEATVVAMGGESGSVLLCKVSDGCGPLEPRLSLAPPGEGQWVSWAVAPEEEWTATVSESRRVHFWRGAMTAQPFHVVDVLKERALVPVTTNEAMFASGSRGRRVAVIPSRDAKWAAIYEVDQYGRNKELILVHLGTEPVRHVLPPSALGCEFFTGVTFDPQSRFLLAWYDAPRGCAAVIDLTPRSSQASLPICPLRDYAGGSLRLSESGKFIASTGQNDDAARLWERNAEGDYERVPEIDDSAVRLLIDAREKWLVSVERRKPSGYSVRLRSLARGEGPRAGRVLNDDAQIPAVAFSPRGTWFVTVARTKGGSQRQIQLWNTEAFDTPHAQWRLPMESVGARIAFDAEERRFIAGPANFLVEYREPPARSLPALLVDLQQKPPAPDRIDIRLEGYDTGCSHGSPSTSCEEISYDFSPDGRWLVTEEPGNVWSLHGKRAQHVLFLAEASSVFSPDSRWMMSATSDGGTRLWRIEGDKFEERGAIGPYGGLHFTKDGRALLLANGQIASHTLVLAGVLRNAGAYAGRNLSVEEWEREFPADSYRKLYPEHPVHASRLDALLTTAKSAHKEGDLSGAKKALSEAAGLAVEGRRVNACITVIRAAISAGVADAARTAADYAVRALEKEAVPLMERARLRLAAQDRAGALQDFRLAVTLGQDESTRVSCREWIMAIERGQSFTTAQLAEGTLEEPR